MLYTFQNHVINKAASSCIKIKYPLEPYSSPCFFCVKKAGLFGLLDSRYQKGAPPVLLSALHYLLGRFGYSWLSPKRFRMSISIHLIFRFRMLVLLGESPILGDKFSLVVS